MSCEIANGYTKPPCANRGGISSIVAINVQNILLDVTNDTVTAITTQTAPAYRIQVDINSGFANQDPTSNRDNNSTVYTQSVMVMLKDDEKTTDQLAAILSEGYFLVVVEYRNGKKKVFGLKNGLFNGGSTGASGQAGGDLNGWTINLNGEEDAIAPHISDSLVTNMIAYSS
jgi:hypothetical protein